MLLVLLLLAAAGTAEAPPPVPVVTHFSIRCPFGGVLDSLAVTLTVSLGSVTRDVATFLTPTALQVPQS